MVATALRDNRSAPLGELHDTRAPLPVRAGKKRQPLEARANWDPWLPVRETHAEIMQPLRTFAIVLLTVVALLVLFLLFAQVAL